MRAFIQQPQSRDEWAVFVIDDESEADISSLLCSDGIWRPFPPFVELSGPPWSPTVRVSGLELHRRLRNPGRSIRPLFLPWSVGREAHEAIKQAAAEQECLPAWLRDALA